MVKWEYSELYTALGSWRAMAPASLIVFRADGKHEVVENYKHGHLIAIWGQQGWEMVSTRVVTFENKLWLAYNFKRQLPE